MWPDIHTQMNHAYVKICAVGQYNYVIAVLGPSMFVAKRILTTNKIPGLLHRERNMQENLNLISYTLVDKVVWRRHCAGSSLVTF